jgi:hypothetical protein
MTMRILRVLSLVLLGLVLLGLVLLGLVLLSLVLLGLVLLSLVLLSLVLLSLVLLGLVLLGLVLLGLVLSLGQLPQSLTVLGILPATSLNRTRKIQRTTRMTWSVIMVQLLPRKARR